MFIKKHNTFIAKLFHKALVFGAGGRVAVGGEFHLVAAKDESVHAVDVYYPLVETAEGVALDTDVLVVAGVLLVRNTAAYGNHRAAPAGRTVHTIVEDVITDSNIPHPRLFVPETPVSLEQYRRAGSVEDVILDDHLPARADQQPPGPVVAYVATAYQHIRVSAVFRHHVPGSEAVRQLPAEIHLRIFAVEVFHALYFGVSAGLQGGFFRKFHLHPGLDEVAPDLRPVTPAQKGPVARKELLHGHIPAVDIGSIILLVAEDAIFHPYVSLAVYEVGGVGGDADDAAASGRRFDIHPQQVNVLGTLGDDAHPAAVVQFYVRQRHPLAVVDEETWMMPVGRPEYQGVPHDGIPEILPPYDEASGAGLLGRIAICRKPVIVGVICHLPARGIELQKVRIGIFLPIRSQEAQLSLHQPGPGILGELQFEEALPGAHDLPFRHEGPVEIYGKVPHRDIPAFLEVEWGDMPGKHQHRPVPFDAEILHTLQLEGNPLHRRIVVADVLVFLEGQSRLYMQGVAGEHQR